MSCQLTNKNSPRLIKENIIQKITIIRKIQMERNQNLAYNELLYLLDYPRLKYNFIKICLAQMYGHQYQQINKAWKQLVKDTKILTDFLVISRKMIEEPWIEGQVNNKNQKDKELQFEKYEYKWKTKAETKQKIKELKGELKIVEGQIDITKNENQNLNLRQKYSKMQEQYNFWRNKSWKLNHLQQLKAANKQGDINTQKFDTLNKLIEQSMKEAKRTKFIQSLGYENNTQLHTSANQNNTDNKNNTKLNTLEQIFEQYAKKQIKETMFFDEMMNTTKNISLQNFLRLIHDSGTAILLTLQQRVKVFKQNSQFDKKVNFVVFTNILQEICRKQCDKLNVKYNSKVLNTYVEELISKIKNKQKSRYLDVSISNQPQTSKINNLRSKIISNYQYKLRTHTGKYKEDIQQTLKRRKQQKKNAQHKFQTLKKSHPSLNSIEQIKTKHREPTIKLKTDFAQSFVYHNSSVKKSVESITKYDDQSNKKKIQYLSSEGNSYSKVFYKKMETYNKNRKFKTQFQKIKQQKQEYMTPKEKSSPIDIKQSPVFRTNDFSSQGIVNPIEQQNKELNKILKLDEDDFFLTTHLKSVEMRAKDIERLINRGQRQIHY